MSRRYINSHLYNPHSNWAQVLIDVPLLGLSGVRRQLPLESYCDVPGTYHAGAMDSMEDAATDLGKLGLGTLCLCGYEPRPAQRPTIALATAS